MYVWENRDLLYILGPFWGVTEGHESTVGQDGEHDQHAEHRGDKVKEDNVEFVFHKPRSLLSWKPRINIFKKFSIHLR